MSTRTASRLARLVFAGSIALVTAPALAVAQAEPDTISYQTFMTPDSAAAAPAPVVAADSAQATAQPAPALPKSIHALHDQLSDETIIGDLQAMTDWRAYVDGMNRASIDLWRTALSKAWLDAARAEYMDNDRTGFPQNAFLRAVNLIGEMQRGADPAGFQNVAPAVPPKGSRRFLDSLYRDLEGMKHDPGFLCAASELAQMEVQLGWAGNESIDQGDCMTSPHVAKARELGVQARRKVEICGPPLLAVRREAPAPPPMELPVPVPQPVVVMPTREELRIPNNVHFALDRSEVSSTSLSVINGVANVMDKYPSIMVRLVGHADSRGDSAYNLRLSRDRVMATRAIFVALGIDSARITTSYRGKAELFAKEDSKKGYALNRRVEMVFVDDEGRDIKLERQEGDLQVEEDRPTIARGAFSTTQRPTVGAATKTGLRSAAARAAAAAKAKVAPGRTTSADTTKTKPAASKPTPPKPVATDNP